MNENRRALSFVVAIVVVGAFATLRCAGGGTKPTQPCTGSGLANDPSGRNCMIPISPTQNCSNGFAAKVDSLATLDAPSFEAETKVAFDPRAGQRTIFAVTIESDTIPNSGGPATTCIVNKRIALYRSTDGGTMFKKMGGLPTGLPGEWATDPTIAVGPDGTLYLVFLRWIGPCAASMDPACNRCSPSSKAVTDVELWFAPPGAEAVQPGLPDSQEIRNALAPMMQNGMQQTAFPTGVGQLPAIAGTNGGADHPEIAVDPSMNGHIAVYVRAPSGNDFVASFKQPSSTALFAASDGPPIVLPGASVFANPVFDGDGKLYVAMGLFVPSGGTAPALPTILKFAIVNSVWAQVGSLGTPPLAGRYAWEQAFVVDTNAQTPSTPPLNFLPETTPALAVGKLGNSTDAIVYMGFEVFDSNNVRRIEIVAANGSVVTNEAPNWPWITQPQLLPLPANGLMSFHPTFALNGASDALDVVANAVVGTAGAVPSALAVPELFHRYDASSLALLAGPLAVNKAAPSLSDLPRRPSASTFANINTVYPGDYNGVVVNGLNASVSFSELRPSGPANVDLAVAQVSTKCGSALTLVDPDSLWECECQCGGSESFFAVVGCAAGTATTFAAACPQICAGQNLCGASLTCTIPACSGSAGGGRRLSTQSCALSDGPPARSAPAPLADYVGAATPASNAVLHVGGQATTTALPGQIYINASTSPPTAGATAEIARLDMRPADVFVGGSVNAQIRNILVLHPGRIAGTFTDATHFTVAPGGATFVTTLQTGSFPDPDNPDATGLSAPTNIALSNPTPITGTLDLANGTIALDGTASDSLGNSLDLHFRSTITGRPSDSDNDGIIDAVDRCPGTTPGPDRTAPVFTFVPPSKIITSCSGAGASIGTAVATDPCGVTVTSNAPSKFPLGTTVVTWTARDAAGNVATATQVITAVVGNDTSCCPTGSHIVVGTSNNDVIVGTSGVDCILGLGGQDRISGGGGDDVISGGDGDDVIFGEAGNDKLYGGSGQDTISGGLGNDLIDGGNGVDTLNGDDGNDLLRGGQGGDIIRGGRGVDFIDGGLDDDQLHGDDDNDTIFGGAGNDRLFGENGNDTLDGEDGDDTLDGGAGVNQLSGGTGHNICIDNGATIECSEEDD